MEKHTVHLKTFSDGIFAVAITLLSIEVGIDISSIEAHHSIKASSNFWAFDALIGFLDKAFFVIRLPVYC